MNGFKIFSISWRYIEKTPEAIITFSETFFGAPSGTKCCVS